jgi:hypothetical protein
MMSEDMDKIYKDLLHNLVHREIWCCIYLYFWARPMSFSQPLSQPILGVLICGEKAC